MRLLTQAAFAISLFISGFAVGIYALPIMIAPPSASEPVLDALASKAKYQGQFIPELADSDFLHFGDGVVSLSNTYISFEGEISPGPDYRLYLTDRFIETEAAFLDRKHQFIEVAPVTNFNGFIIELPSHINIENYNSVVIWCEHFKQFITAAKYK